MERWQRAWLQSRDNPYLFVTDVLGVEGVYPWQADVLKDIAAQIAKADPAAPVFEPIRVGIKAGHTVGKTTLEAWIVLWAVLTRTPVKEQITANSEDQIRDTIWPEIGIWMDKLPAELRERLDKNSDRICVKGAEDINFVTWRVVNPSRPEAVQGLHSDHVVLIVDEASGIPDSYFNAVMGSLSAKRFALMILAGNPTQPLGFFYDTFTKMRERWRCFTVNSEDVPAATGHIADVIARSGKDSNEYRVRVLGEFPLATDDSVISLAMCEGAIKRDVQAIKTLAPVWGLDVARFGDDSSALAKRQANMLLEPVKLRRNMDGPTCAAWVRDEWGDTPYDMRPAEILVDSIGYGASALDHLRLLGLPARGINVGEAAASKDRYNRLRDELWFKGREWFQAADCKIPNDPLLISQLTAPTYKFLPTGKIQVASKDDMKALGQSSPDAADAFLLTLAGGFHKAVAIDKYRKYRGKPKGQGRSWQAA